MSWWQVKALDALKADDGAALAEATAHDPHLCAREKVFEDGTVATAFRVASGWSGEALAAPCFLPESLERRAMQAEVGDTMVHIAERNGKTACLAVLRSTAPVNWHAKALDALKADDGAALAEAMAHDPRSCVREKVFADGLAAVAFRLDSGWSREDSSAIPCFLPESLTRRAMQAKVGDTMVQIAELNGKAACLAVLAQHEAAEVAATGSTSIFSGAAVGDLSLGAGGVTGRQQPVDEASIKILPRTRWEDIVPPCTCADYMRSSAAVRAACPQIDSIADDCAAKAEELRFEEDLPAALPADELVALAAYSHDLGTGQAGNLYFELNNALRKRGKDDRTALVDGWGGFMHHIMGGLARLPKVACVCYRGFPGKATVITQYKIGRPIQWGAFSSTSTDFDATKGFTNQATGVIFKITVTDGRDINAYSFFPQEAEVLLLPAHRFTVCSAPYERDGFTIIDMVQQDGSAFVS
jgi:hypothetical protein